MRLKIVMAISAALLLAACSSKPADTGGGTTGGTTGGSTTTTSVPQAAQPGSPQDFVTNIGDRVFFGTDRSDLTQEAQAELQKQEAKAQALASSKTTVGWGHQIRSYVLQPYQLVKDLRTGRTSTAPGDVLDGDLDDFLEASLAQRVYGATEEVEDID